MREIALPVPKVSGKRSAKAKKTTAPPSPVSAAEMPASHRRRGARSAPTGWVWRSHIGADMRDFLRLRRSLGRQYMGHERVLLGLDYFLCRRFPNARTLTAPAFEEWAKGLRSLCPTTARMRMTWVRQFCRHLSRLRSGVFVPDLRTFPKELPHAAPRLLSEAEIAGALTFTSVLRRNRSNPLHPRTICMAFTLLYCCGLRHGEVRRLKLGDIDSKNGVLRVVASKFNKSRMVPMSSSVTREMRRYLNARRRCGMPCQAESPLVWNGYPSRTDAVTATPFWMNWQHVCRLAGLVDSRGRPPRLHDLRHSFAVEALRRGYGRGREPNAVLPRLARYMGQAGAQFTHYYLKFTEPLRCAAAERTRPHRSRSPESQPTAYSPAADLYRHSRSITCQRQEGDR